MDMIGRIRRLHGRKKKSVREIARITGLSRNTISKWLHGEVDGPPKYRRSEQPSKLTAFHDVLRQALKADARRPRHDRRLVGQQIAVPDQAMRALDAAFGDLLMAIGTAQRLLQVRFLKYTHPF